MSDISPLERILRHDRLIVIVSLVIVIFVCWLYLLDGAGTGMSTFGMTSWKMALGISEPLAVPVDWDIRYARLMFIMWWIMMVAMMLPSAAPMILLYTGVNRRTSAKSHEKFNLLPTVFFTVGYLAAWAVLSAVATGLQWAFEGMGVLSPTMMNSTNQIFAGLVLLFAGAYQLTPLKQACLKHCRGPIGFLANHWRRGNRGAFEMGLHHGAYCLGCCWGLMAILFFGGIMNLYWIIGLAVLVLLEKVMPVGRSLSYLTGGLLILWGAVVFML